jgi:hypothetical protein
MNTLAAMLASEKRTETRPENAERAPRFPEAP